MCDDQSANYKQTTYIIKFFKIRNMSCHILFTNCRTHFLINPLNADHRLLSDKLRDNIFQFTFVTSRDSIDSKLQTDQEINEGIKIAFPYVCDFIDASYSQIYR